MSQRSRKRAKLETIENAKRNERIELQSHQVDNTTFLSLPREARQNILAKVLADALSKDFALIDNLTFLWFKLLHPSDFRPDRSHVRAPHLGGAASTLAKIHPVVENDIPYILNKQLAKIETYYDSCNALGGVRAYERTEFWKAKALQWAPLIHLRSTDIELQFENLHQVLEAMDPTDTGCRETYLSACFAVLDGFQWQ